jgi:hypothetical protein
MLLALITLICATYMYFKGMGVEQNQNKGKGLTIELFKSIFKDGFKNDKLKNDKTGILLSCIKVKVDNETLYSEIDF